MSGHRPRVLAFLFDDENEDKFAGHGLSPVQVAQILENEHVLLRNRKRRRARYLIIGRDHGGTCIAVPIELTPYPTIWRPITAWRCKDSERTKLESSYENRNQE